jgi:hypothetical protein
LFACLVICAGGCARGYEADPARGELPLQVPETAVTTNPQAATPDAGAPDPVYSGEACMRGDVAVCVCAATGTEGTKTCRFDESSPTQGTFTECASCAAPDSSGGDVPEPDAGASGSGINCADGMQNGAETDVDCGGSDCPSCLIGDGCETSRDCSAGECTSGTCQLPGGGGGLSGGGQGSNRCMPACSQVCFPVGILPCCNPLGICGCTWAPGAYCL